MRNFQQSIGESDIAAVVDALKSVNLTRGPITEQFEQALAKHSKMPYAVVFSSATAALHAVMRLVLKPGDSVIVPPLTFAATANAVLYAEGKVIFSDIEEETLCLDPDKLTDLEKVKAVVAVDFAGNLCNYDKLKKLQRKYGFKLIADAAHSIGGRYKGQPVGSLADYTIFSFHPVKNMTTGEGGAVLCRSEADAKWLKQFRSHGITREGCKSGFYRQEFLGFNYNMTELQAALGLSQLKRLKAFVQKRAEIVSYYRELLPGVWMPKAQTGSYPAWHFLPIQIEGRDQLVAKGIGNVHYIPVYLHPYYQQLGYKQGACPIAEKVYKKELSLPVFPELSKRDILEIVEEVEK